MNERIARAKQWLESSTPTTTDDKAFRLLGLQWTESDQAIVRQAADVLRREQNPDGGWAQLRGMNSDAYATGLAGGTTSSDPDARHRHGLYARRRVPAEDTGGRWLVAGAQTSRTGQQPLLRKWIPTWKISVHLLCRDLLGHDGSYLCVAVESTMTVLCSRGGGHRNRSRGLTGSARIRSRAWP